MKIMQNDYQKNKLKTVFNVTSIYTVHYFKYGKNFSCDAEKHDFWEMIFIDSGSAMLIYGDKEFELKQGQAYLLKPNVLHAVHTKDDFANSVIVSFECTSRATNALQDKIFEFLDYEKMLLNKIITEAKLAYNEKLNDIYLSKMTKRDSAPKGSDQLIKNCIELLLISLYKNTDSHERNFDIADRLITESKDKIAESIISFLNANLYSAINLDLIADETAFSKTYIKTVFKKQTGTSIIQYYINLKIEEAKKLLSQQKYTVTEVADMLNFNSVHYFSRRFKLITGMPPTEYKSSIQAENVL